MANVTYVVKKGDCLWSIAKAKLGSGLKYKQIASLNNISEPYIIHTGQTLIISSDSGGSGQETTTSTAMTRPKIEFFSLQAGTDRGMFVAWTWSRSNTESYRVVWSYFSNGLWFVGNDSTVTYDSEIENERSTYTAPTDATQVRVKIKPISKKRTVNKKETSYWTAEWSSYKTYSFSDNPPTAPSGPPTVELIDFKLTASSTSLNNVNGTHVEFQVVRDDSKVFASGIASGPTTLRTIVQNRQLLLV